MGRRVQMPARHRHNGKDQAQRQKTFSASGFELAQPKSLFPTPRLKTLLKLQTLSGLTSPNPQYPKPSG